MTNSSMAPLEAFPAWLASLAVDAEALAGVLRDESIPESVRLSLAGALNYLLRSIDLIPDGVEDLGYLDDAFVLRVSALLGREQAEEGWEHPVVGPLADAANLIAEFLGEDMVRLRDYVANLRIVVVRGRSPADVVADDHVAGQLAEEIGSFARSFEIPSFHAEDKTLIKLRSFLRTKLP